MDTESLAAMRLALFAKRDAILKENQDLHTVLNRQSEELISLCSDLSALLLDRESCINAYQKQIATQNETIRILKVDLTKRQTELNTLRREIATLRQAPRPSIKDEPTSKRAKSMERALQKQRKEQFLHHQSLESQIGELTATLAKREEQLRQLQAKWEDSQLRYLKMIKVNQSQQEEPARLRQTPSDTACSVESAPSTDTDDNDSIDPIISELNRHAHTLTISVVGGSPTWQQKAQASFPSLRFLGNQDFDSSKLDNTDILLVNTNHVSHSCTKKAVDLATSHNTEICYTSKHNLSQIATLLCDRIRSLLS